MIGQTISHYRVLGKIGEGGMGEVYLAEDTRLDRKVALKFLPQYLQQDEVAQKRFVREAKSAAAIDHPFVCKIYEPRETEDFSFIVMEYVEGDTLQKKMGQGRLSLKEALHIASEIAEALEEAHKKGIVHRDLKPANVMLTPGGHIKVMDFGLAKRLQPRGNEEEITAALTREGTTLGTLTYMSPEQLRGRKVDTRSDIFSFGVVLYEMLTGVHPFRTGTQAETINSILNEHPSAISHYTEDTSDILEHTVDKMLAKNPADRYQLVHEVGTNLKKLSDKLSISELDPRELSSQVRAKPNRWLTAGASLVVLVALILAVLYIYQSSPASLEEGPIDSIAVPSLFNVSGHQEDEFRCSGIAFSISFALSQLSSLRVLPTSELRRYRGQEITARLVGDELDVRAVVIGELMRQGDTVSIQVELIDVKENRLLWGKHYSQEVNDIIEVTEEMAREIAQALRPKLSETERGHLAKRYTENPKAHEYYLQGQFFWEESEPKRAEECFRRAIEIDPTYALAYVGLANACGQLSFWLTSPEYQRKARNAVKKAVALDETLAEAHYTLGSQLAFHDKNWLTAGDEFRRAKELNPNLSGDRWMMYLLFMGQFEEAKNEFSRLIDRKDPRSLSQLEAIGLRYYWMRQYELVLEQVKRIQELDPDRSVPYYVPWCYQAMGRQEEAFQALMAASAVHEADERKEYQQIFEESGMKGVWLLYSEKRKTPLKPIDQAGCYALAEEKDKAFEWLDTASERTFPVPVSSPRFDSLRSDPRFEKFLRKLHLPEEAIQRHLVSPTGS